MKRTTVKPYANFPSSEMSDLRAKLDRYYSSSNEYKAFAEPSQQENCWNNMKTSILKKIKESSNKKINILEIGAGKSGFGNYLKTLGIRENINWIVQDVTCQNSSWLESNADVVYYSDISKINNTNIDIIFSTYVLEHVTDPIAHLNKIENLLNPEGIIYIFCPRYDIPGYLCPSSRHLNIIDKTFLLFDWAYARFISYVQSKPVFLIQTDLAVFYKPYFIDADAVHWVSLHDLKLWGRSKGFLIERLKTANSKKFQKDWLVKNYLTCALKFYKR